MDSLDSESILAVMGTKRRCKNKIGSYQDIEKIITAFFAQCISSDNGYKLQTPRKIY